LSFLRKEHSLKANRAIPVTFLLLFAVAAPPAHAWGCRGHETIAALAERHLTPEAKQAVLGLLAGNAIDPQLKRYCGQRGLDPFIDASTWADDERGREPATAPWHFIDIPLNVTDPAQIKSFCAGGCVIQAITEQLAILNDKTAPGAKRAAALRYLIHFVGDLHQPLHDVSNADRGGNCVPVQYFRRKPRAKNNNYTPNLHQLWDTAILERDMEGADPAEFADQLEVQFAGSFSAWQQSGVAPEIWAWEGHEAARQTVYGELGAATPKEPEVPVNSCADDNNIGQRLFQKHLVIGAAYQEQAAAIIEQRLAQAGIRLAMLLNAAALPRP
jgi:S1/P1 Nuclease